MTIRMAQVADLPSLLILFVDLLDYLKGENPNLDYSRDRDKIIGGCLETLRGKMITPGHIVLVAEENGEIRGFCAGQLLIMPSFFEHELVGACEWLYPLDIPLMRSLVAAFDKWAINNGATGRTGYTPADTKSEKLMIRNRMALQTSTFFKAYPER